MLNKNSKFSPSNDNILQHIIKELFESVENDPVALKEALAEEGINQDELVQEGLQFIHKLEREYESGHPNDALEEQSKASKKQKTNTIISKWMRLFTLPRYGLAAAVIIILSISIYLYKEIVPVRYVTGRKEELTKILPDGTEVKLNSESNLSFGKNFNKSSREVKLVGEGYFDVRKGNLLFIISTDIASVRVLGTQFNVMARDSLFEVAVNEGVVTVTSNHDSKDSVTLTKGYSTRFQKGEIPKPPQLIRFEQYPGWIHERMTFYESSLKLVVEEIERRFDVTIKIAKTVNHETLITGLFNTEDFDNLLSAICLSIKKNHRVENGVYKIY